MRNAMWIGLFGTAALLFGAADTAKADHCYGGGFGSFGGFRSYNVAPSFGVYNYGYSPRYYSGFSSGFYRGSGITFSFGRRSNFIGGRGFYRGGSRGFGRRGFGGRSFGRRW